MKEFLVNNAWIVPALPLLGGLIAGLGGSRLRERAYLPVAIGIALAFLYSAGLIAVSGSESTSVVYHWLDVSRLHIPVEFRVDGLSAMMLGMVTFVATLVAVFASGYMAGDPGYPRFFFLVGLFVFAMTGLVLSNNYVLTYAFWEGVGVCSYLLIGFWHSKPAAAAAAKKAFLVNRIGDVGFAVAIFWMWTVAPDHDLRYDTVLAPGAIVGYPALGIALLLFWAATAKSAQLPLYVWLPDAMEGPTPVSALIHAATMVTAGVYLLARSSVLLAEVPVVALVVCITGCLTALLAALIALTQTDLKRVMAYSTVSQLGFMFMALGAGVGDAGQIAVVAAMFHLFTHAFFKALLFLASGSVMHAMGGVIDMRRFGGLRHKLPYTHWTFLIGALSLSGIPPLAGFFSKDEILVALQEASKAAEHAGHNWGSVYTAIWVVALVTAGLTAFYTGRAYFMTFWGPEKLPSPDDPEAEPAETEVDVPVHGHDAAHGHGHDDHGHGHGGHEIGHESPPIMTIPLMVLAACTVLVGLAFGPITGWFEHQILATPGLHELGHAEHEAGLLVPVLGTTAGLLGLGLAYLFYASRGPIPGRVAARLGPLYRLSLHKFRVDEIYGRLVVLPAEVLAKVSAFLDIYLVDGLVRAVAWVPRAFGTYLLAPYQNGLIQYYAAATALGLAAGLALLLLL